MMNQHLKNLGLALYFLKFHVKHTKKSSYENRLQILTATYIEYIQPRISGNRINTYHLHPKENTLVDTGKRMVRILPVKKE